MQPKSSPLRRLTSSSAIYGTIVYAGLVGASSVYEEDDVEQVLFTSAITLVVFWLAHVYSAALAHHGDDRHEGTVTLGASIRHGFEESFGMLLSAVLPTIPLIVGVAGGLAHEQAVNLALQVSTLMLFVLGCAAFVVRGSRWWWCLLGGVATALFGVVIIVLEAATH
jgi:drug/metabolite transporter (DMT)-like permease